MVLRVVEVYVRKTDLTDSAIRYLVQENVSGEWNEREHIDVNAGTVGARRKFLLEPHERLVVEDISAVVVEYDPVQMATKKVFGGKLLPQPAEETEYSTQIGDKDGDMA